MNSLTELHTKQANKLALIFVCVDALFMILSTILYAPGRFIFSTSFMLVFQIVFVLLSILTYIKKGNDPTSRNYYVFLSCASYTVVLLGSVHVPYLWAFAPMILFTTVIYQNKRLTQLSSFYLIGINFAYMFFCIVIDPDFWGHKFQSFTNCAFAVLTGIMAYSAVKLLDKQNSEKVTEIEDAAAEQLKNAKQVQQTADTISQKLEEADTAMSSLSDKVKASAEAVEQISQSITLTAEAIQTQTEMNANITESLDHISEESKEMDLNSKEVTERIYEGNEIIKSLLEKSEEVSLVNKETSDMTAALKDSAETVKNILSTILTISSQTNLLALNASIEAARAGEAGKGFAVVADEIRQLSENTKTSAEEIAATIDDLLKKVALASNNMDKSVLSANEQGEMVNQTGEKFELILSSINELSAKVKLIGENVASCVDANTQVMDAISNLSATSQEVAASAETSMDLSADCENDMNSTKAILDQILAVSRKQI